MAVPAFNKNAEQSTILKWEINNGWQRVIDFDYPATCPVCKSRLYKYSHKLHTDMSSFNERDIHECIFCGWFLSYSDITFVDYCSGDENAWERGIDSRAILKEFPINSCELEIAEIAAYLKKHHSDIYNLSWDNFERLINDIFRNYGHNAVLTQKTRDKGADVLIYNKSGTNVTSIIECKKYKESRKVGVYAVRALAGAAINWDVRKVYLATTSNFSPDARKLIIDYHIKGYEIDLIAASDIFKMLEIYNVNLPPLQEMTKEFRNELFKKNLLVR